LQVVQRKAQETELHFTTFRDALRPCPVSAPASDSGLFICKHPYSYVHYIKLIVYTSLRQQISERFFKKAMGFEENGV
jgi:hypothetical protein